MRDGRDVWAHELVEGQSDDPASCPCEPMDSEDLLYLLYTSGTTAKPKGIVHTTGGYLTGVATTHHYIFDVKPDSVYWCAADIGWVTGHSYIVYGPLANATTGVLYEGVPDYPDRDRWWAIVERYSVDILYTAPTAIRAHMKWGPEHAAEARPLLAAAPRLGRRADQPRGLDLVPGAHRRRPLPDRRHVVADRDRDDPDHAAPGRHDDEARAPRRVRSPASTPPSSTTAARRSPRAEAATSSCAGPWPAMLRGIYKDHDRFVETYWSRFPGHVLRRRRRPRRRGRRLLAHGPRRRRHERLRPPHLDDRGRERPRRPPEGRRGGGVRAQGRDDRPGDRRLRQPQGRRGRARPR